MFCRTNGERFGFKTEEFIANKEKIDQINPEKYITEDIGILGIKDILKELLKPGLDQENLPKFLNLTEM